LFTGLGSGAAFARIPVNFLNVYCAFVDISPLTSAAPIPGQLDPSTCEPPSVPVPSTEILLPTRNRPFSPTAPRPDRQQPLVVSPAARVRNLGTRSKISRYLQDEFGRTRAECIAALRVMKTRVGLLDSLIGDRPPRSAARPPLQIARPAALLGGLRQGSYDKVVTGGEQTLKQATETLRDGSGSALLGTLALAVAVGLLVGRRLTDHRTVRRTL